jgi:Cdc6-like AAA superfamily ATPase
VINPFRNTIVIDPWTPPDADVYEINAGAFELCREALDKVRAEGRSTAVFLYGEVGSGKTHLLARFCSYIKEHAQLFIFLAIRLDTNPNRLWRHIRNGFVASLLRTVKGSRSQLEFVFMRRLYLHSMKKHLTLTQLRRDIDELSVEAELSWNTSKVIENLVRKRHRKDSIGWLKGKSLPFAVLEKIGLAPEQFEPGDPEGQARSVIKELCRLAGPSIPVVICLDQVEALQRYPQDTDGLFILGRAVRALQEETNNVLLTVCLQPFLNDPLKEAITEADHTARGINEIALTPLTFDQSMKLVRARLESCVELSDYKASLYDELEAKLKQIVWLKSGRTSRDVLTRCADIFETWGESESIKEVFAEPKQSDAEFLSAEITKRLELAIQTIQPEQMEEIIQSAVSPLVHILDENWSEQDQIRTPDVDIILESPATKVAISFCNQQNLRSLAGRFKRLGGQIGPGGFDKLILMRHPGFPIRLGAKKTRDYFEKLRLQNAVFYSPDIELVAALEALRSLLADVKAGDLSNGAKTVSSNTAIDWLKISMPIPVLDFLNQIIGDNEIASSADFEILQDLHSLLEEERIIKLVDAAVQLATDPNRLQHVAGKFAGQIGFLQGPPPVIFQYIPGSARG